MTFKTVLLFCLTFAMLTACEKVNDDRIPPVPAYLALNNAGLWNTYGVAGYGQFRYFNKNKRIPSNYSYKETDYTGFGGILLIEGIDGPLAYDRACPVEATTDAVLTIDSDNYEAVCSKCGSRFNVCEAAGAPISGKAHELKYGLRRFSVIAASGGYIITSR